MSKTLSPCGFQVSQYLHFLLVIGLLLPTGCSTAQEPLAASTAQEKKPVVRSAIARAKFKAGDFAAAIEILQSLSKDATTTEREKVGANFALGEVYFANGQALSLIHI